MRDLPQSFKQPQSMFATVIWGMPAAIMFIVLTVASCTTTDGFNEVYSEVTGFFSLGGTFVAKWLHANPGFGHLFAYALLSLFLSGLMSRRWIMAAPLIAVTFGLLMEVVQVFIPSREASLIDIGINILGVAIGFGLYMLWVTYVQFAFSRKDIKPRIN